MDRPAPTRRAPSAGPPPRPSARHVAEYALVRVLGFFLRRLPPDAASALMGSAFALLMPLTSRHARALEHLALALPDLTIAERKRIARAMWRHLGRVAGEAFQIDRIIADESRVVLPADFEHYRARVANGAISAAAHLGNWEIAGVVPRRAGLRLAGVYQRLHNPLVERYLKHLRTGVYPAGLHSKGPELGATLVSLLRRGAGVGIVADFREKRGIGVTFFGEPAFATPLPAMLARATGRPIIAGAVIRTRGVRFRCVLAEVAVPTTDDREADIAVATQALHAVYEGWIREAPEQWMWTHRKWARSRVRPLTLAVPGGGADLPAPHDVRGPDTTGPVVPADADRSLAARDAGWTADLPAASPASASASASATAHAAAPASLPASAPATAQPLVDTR